MLKKIRKQKLQPVKKSIVKELELLFSQLSRNQIYAIAIKLDVNVMTLNRYFGGDVRDAETAQAIIDAANEELAETLETEND
jgi:hypothetical protein